MSNQGFSEDFESLARRAFELVEPVSNRYRSLAREALKFRGDDVGLPISSSKPFGIRSFDESDEVLSLESQGQQVYLQHIDDDLVGVVIPSEGTQVELQTPDRSVERRLPDAEGSFEFSNTPVLYRLVFHGHDRSWCTPWRT